MGSKKDLNRRKFIKVAGIGTSFLLFGGILRVTEGGNVFLRPPGAVGEKDFLSRCIKCQKCLQVCPRRVIVPLSLGDSVSAVSTPTLNFRNDYCDLCMKCTEVCPSGAILPLKKEAVNLGLAVINKDACVAWDWEGCTLCSAKCPEDAISLDGRKRPVVDEAKCNGCGLCEYICPSSSLRAYNEEKAAKGVRVVPVATKNI